MAEIFKEAASIASGLPESMQEAAFNRALDVLLQQRGLLEPTEGRAETPKSTSRRKSKKRSTKRTAPKKLAPKQLKDLNLRPGGKPSFKDFVNEKRPANNPERMLTAVFYLTEVLGIQGVTVDHVYSCYRDRAWPAPADLANGLAVAAHRKGWLHTSDLTDISVAVHGDNHIRYEMPPTSKPSVGK